MVLQELNIINFKNITGASLEFSPRFNCLVGKNGMGKTNILDAIYHLSMCKSYFNHSDVQNINHDQSFFVIQGKYVCEDENIDIYCGVKKGQKKVFKKNQKPYAKFSEHIGLLPLVMISPEDFSLIEGGSEERRQMIDSIISQCDHEYLHRLIRYNRALTQRNSLLKSYAGKPFDPEVIEIWDEQLAEHGEVIMQKRLDFVQDFHALFQFFYKQLSLGREEVNLLYKPSVPSGQFLNVLKDNLGKDHILTYTSSGCHRDDLQLNIGQYSVRKTGSQGQKKTFLIALKLAQYTWLAKAVHVKPLLLLDDIFDKLDADRVNQIINIVGSEDFGQIFITDTNREHLDEILKNQHIDFTLFQVDNGEVNPFFVQKQ